MTMMSSTWTSLLRPEGTRPLRRTGTTSKRDGRVARGTGRKTRRKTRRETRE